MGGDHKCPVCQATFTRPQHVARHMRSHTGDRPYKCQYCGDQFARSDLLSRHVNKCHANEKPTPTSNTGRRKGAVSATRATTSKQACDQCVQSSLPCDGCNPCSKCVSRKCRCTYVKFHRQTAPLGPGHTRPNAPPDISSSSSLPSSSFSNEGLPLYQHSDDEFVLGPAPGSVPTMAETLYTSNSFAFPPLYPPNTDLSHIPDNLDYGVKYRTQQAEFFGPGRSGGLTPLYDPRHGSSTPNPPWLGWESQDSQDVFHHPQHQGHRQVELMLPHSPSSAMHAAPNFGNQHNGDNHPDDPPISIPMPYAPLAVQRPHTNSRQYGQGGDGSSYDSSRSNSRRGSVDFSGSDSASGSMPGSANTSGVHLPAEGNSVGYGNIEYNLADNRIAGSTVSSNSSQYDSHDERQEFSSAFGLMSLDSPTVIAGLAVDGQPFFDDASQAHNQQDPERDHDGLLTTDVGPDNDTPMPLKRDAPNIQLGSRPATSSGILSEFGIGNSPKEGDTRELREFWKQYMRTPLSGPPPDVMVNFKNGSSTAHRRQRVASLPAAKTPMVERDDMFAFHPPPCPQQRGTQQSSLRTTLHVREDLRSYEAAVMARKAPTLNLNLQLKRPTKGSRPASSAGVTMFPSTLANAFGEMVCKEESEELELRPSFKRLASQTLGPEHSKRAFFGFEEEEGGEDGTFGSIAERRGRRMSAQG